MYHNNCLFLYLLLLLLFFVVCRLVLSRISFMRPDTANITRQGRGDLINEGRILINVINHNKMMTFRFKA